jgi:hypothetical protein
MRFPDEGKIGAFCGVLWRGKRVIGALESGIFPSGPTLPDYKGLRRGFIGG